MNNQDERTIRVIGTSAFQQLQERTVLVFGLGGVGGYVVEALVRAGIRKFKLVDHDIISESNLNRQIIALHSTIGCEKTEVIKRRMLDIRPDCHIQVYDTFYLPDQIPQGLFDDCDYIVDAIDTITAKIDIVLQAQQRGIPLISCMGTGNKLHPSQLEITDIYQTTMCPVCKIMRRELKKRQVASLKVLYSPEKPIATGNRVPGSVSFVPSVAGLLIASEVVLDFLK